MFAAVFGWLLLSLNSIGGGGPVHAQIGGGGPIHVTIGGGGPVHSRGAGAR
jgi:hypothetical protein